MRILQAIWDVLIIENASVIKIMSIPFTFLEVYLLMLLFTSVLQIKHNRNQEIFYVSISSVISIICNFLLSPLYCTFVNVFLLPVLVFLIFKSSILKSIISLFIVYIVSFLIGSPLLLIVTEILGISSNSFNNIPIFKLIYIVTFYFILYLIYKLISRKRAFITILDRYKSNKNNFILMLNFIIGFITIVLQIYIEFYYIDYLPNNLVFTSAFISLIYFSISLFSLLRTSKLEIANQNLEEEKLYNKTLTILYDNIRGFKHDFNNIVQAIGGYISTNDMSGLKVYYNGLIEDCQKVNNLSFLNPEVINNSAIYSLLTAKYHTADEIGIKINLDVFANLKILNIRPYELTRILGILLDNAIEASSKCALKLINITFRKDKKANRDLIIIENTYINKDVNTDKIYEKGYSSKIAGDKQNHGLGLWEVRQILKKSNNLNLFTSKNDEFFKQQLEIYN